MSEFSFAPNPALGWGGRSNMGTALWEALQRGLGMQRMFEDQSYNSVRHDMDMHLMPFDGQRQYWEDRNATDLNRASAASSEDALRQNIALHNITGDQLDTPYGNGFTTPFAPMTDTPMSGGVAGGYVSPNVGGPNTASKLFVPHPHPQAVAAASGFGAVPTMQTDAFNHFANGTAWPTVQSNLFNPNWQPGANQPAQFPAGYFNSAFGG